MRSKKGIEFLDFPQVDIDDILAFNQFCVVNQRHITTLTEIPEVSKVRNNQCSGKLSVLAQHYNVFDKWRFAEFVFYQEGVDVFAEGGLKDVFQSTGND